MKGALGGCWAAGCCQAAVSMPLPAHTISLLSAAGSHRKGHAQAGAAAVPVYKLLLMAGVLRARVSPGPGRLKGLSGRGALSTACPECREACTALMLGDYRCRQPKVNVKH